MPDGGVTRGSARSIGYPFQAAILGVTNSTIQLVQAFGVALSPSENAAVVAFINALWVAAMAWLAYRANGNNRPAAP